MPKHMHKGLTKYLCFCIFNLTLPEGVEWQDGIQLMHSQSDDVCACQVFDVWSIDLSK